MESLIDFALQERDNQVKDLGDRLGELATLIICQKNANMNV